MGKVRQFIGDGVFYGTIFSRSAGACPWVLGQATDLRAILDAAVEPGAATPPDPSPAEIHDAVGVLREAWERLASGLTPTLQPLLDGCGWAGLVPEDDVRYAAAILQLVTEAADEFGTFELDHLQEFVCQRGETACAPLRTQAERRRQAERESAEVQERADTLSARCNDCGAIVEDENYSLQYRCLSGEDYDACRSLRRLVQNRCSDSCNPWERCRKCLADIEEEVGSSGLERLAGDRCGRACR
jgi:hypothetical protein